MILLKGCPVSMSDKGCSPTGKVPNNEFVVKTLKLYHIFSDGIESQAVR